MFDLTPMTKHLITGPDALAFLNRLVTRDVAKIKPGKVGYCVWCDDNGQVIDDGTIFHLREGVYRLCSQERQLDWLTRSAFGFDVTIEEDTHDVAAVALQGPTSCAVLKAIGCTGAETMKPFDITYFPFAGSELMVSRTGFTGDLGYELWIDPPHALDLWDALFDKGKIHGIRPMGTHALEVARIEAGFIQAQVDFHPADQAIMLDRSRSPFELDLAWLVDFNKPVFNGRRALLEEKKHGSRFRFVKLDVEGNKPARSAYIYDKDKNVVGTVTSAEWSPSAKTNIAYASMHMPWGRPEDELWAEIYYQRELRWSRVMARCRVVAGRILGSATQARDARRGFLTASRGAGMAHRLDPLLRPRSIAVLGATEREGTVGRHTIENLLKGGYEGGLYAVNPGRKSVLGVPCYPSLDELPEPVEHVIFAIADTRIEAALEEVIAHGARAATIMSSLVLADDSDPPLRDRVLARIRSSGLVVCGANGMGFYNFVDGIWGCGFRTRMHRRGGNVAYISHSGSGMCGIVDSEERIDFSLVVSTGQELAVAMDEYLDFALDQPETRVVGLFMETARNPAGLVAAFAKARDRRIPIVALKVGRTEFSARLTVSHSGAIAGQDAVYDAIFDRYGVHRARDMDELATTLILFAQPHPVGSGGLVSIHDSGGERQLLIDLAHDHGVPLTQLDAASTAKLEELLDPGPAGGESARCLEHRRARLPPHDGTVLQHAHERSGGRHRRRHP